MSEVFNGQTSWRPIPRTNTNNSHNLLELKLCLPDQPASLHFPRKRVNTQLSFCLSSALLTPILIRKVLGSSRYACLFMWVSPRNKSCTTSINICLKSTERNQLLLGTVLGPKWQLGLLKKLRSHSALVEAGVQFRFQPESLFFSFCLFTFLLKCFIF